MALLKTTALASSMAVTVVDPNNVNIAVTPNNAVKINVTPTPNNNISISRGIAGPQGPSGEANIGGYPINIVTAPQNYDALMFVTGAWTNIPQTEISDGGNF
jgi:hypothetical protein